VNSLRVRWPNKPIKVAPRLQSPFFRSMSAETSLEPCAAGRVGRITACPAVGAPHKPPRVMRRSEQALYRSAGDSWAGRTRARHGAPRMPGDGERTHLAGSVVPRSIVICGVHALGQSARGRLCGASPPPPAAHTHPTSSYVTGAHLGLLL